MIELPIDAHLSTITHELRAHRSIVIVAEPGAGKTTRVPPAILETNLLPREHPNIVMLQPRRVAARASAMRIADERGWTLGEQVGYHVRFDRKFGPRTRLRVVTEGILTRQLLDDPFIEKIGCVILDEFHERNLNTDLAIAMLREVRQSVREDLMLVVMSATLEAEPVAKFLGDCPIIRVPGRTFPVEIIHAPSTEPRLVDRVSSAIQNLNKESGRQESGQERGHSSFSAAKTGAAQKAAKKGTLTFSRASEMDVEKDECPLFRSKSGDVLVFLPGAQEIRRVGEQVADVAESCGWDVRPLHGSLEAEQQMAALAPSTRRKIILATNIAETSLTIDGVTTVIDGGFARVAGYDPQRGLDHLELKRISKASAAQRAGRAGRTAPGRCIRLWSAKEDAELPDFELPEIRRVDLAGTVLALHAWGKPDPRTFGWYERPDESILASAERLLAMLGALDSETNGNITALGRRILALPVHPRLARLLLAAADDGMLEEGAALAALLSEKDLMISDGAARPRDRVPRAQGDSDLLARLEMLYRAEEARFARSLRDEGIDPSIARQVARTRDQLLRIARSRSSDAASAIARSPRTIAPEDRDPRCGSRGKNPGLALPASRVPTYAQTPASEGVSEDLDPGATRAKDSDRREFAHAPLSGEESSRDEALLRLLLDAYPDRICRRRGNDPLAGVMVGGGGVRLARESVVTRAEFFVALDARRDERSATREALVRIASRVELEWIEQTFPQSIRREQNVVFDESKNRVVGTSQLFYRDLLLREERNAPIDPQKAADALFAAIRPRIGALIQSSESLGNLVARIELLAQQMPSHPWPRFDDSGLDALLRGATVGRRSFEDVIQQGLPEAIRSQLVYPMDRLLDEQAPESIQVPTGNRIRLNYQRQESAIVPVLAVRLQELFGLLDTPRIANGKVPVLLHLLGPNYRPVQVTDDLRSFWSRTYPQVRKDLRARYPKHAWPEDPLSAKPVAKGRPTK